MSLPHSTEPFPSHILTLNYQRWTGEYFWPTSLAALGLMVQLNHQKDTCPSPDLAPRNFVVIDTNGIHDVSLQYCDCHLAVPPIQQLLRYGWYPGTTTSPQTAVTMTCLTQFHVLTLQSKITAYDYYYSLARLSDNAGIFKAKVFHYCFRVSSTNDSVTL